MSERTTTAPSADLWLALCHHFFLPCLLSHLFQLRKKMFIVLRHRLQCWDCLHHERALDQGEAKVEVWMAGDNALDQTPNPFIRMELSGIETPTSNALPFHLIQRLSCKITNATEFASTGASSAERMALRSVNPAGWNCSIARDRMLSAVIYLEAINSSLSDSGRALRSSDEARLSSLDHFFC